MNAACDLHEIRAGLGFADLGAMLVHARFNAVTHEIIGAAMEVHRTLGPGLLESTYKTCLSAELYDRKIPFVTERIVPIVFEGRSLDLSYRIDLIVEDLVVVEVKAAAALLSVHDAQRRPSVRPP